MKELAKRIREAIEQVAPHACVAVELSPQNAPGGRGWLTTDVTILLHLADIRSLPDTTQESLQKAVDEAAISLVAHLRDSFGK